MALAHHVRQIGRDMNIRNYEKTGCSQNQVDSEKTPLPVNQINKNSLIP